jgi:hypothetical protein
VYSNSRIVGKDRSSSKAVKYPVSISFHKSERNTHKYSNRVVEVERDQFALDTIHGLVLLGVAGPTDELNKAFPEYRIAEKLYNLPILDNYA